MKLNNAIAVILKLLMVGEKKFHILTAVDFLKDIFNSARLVYGKRVFSDDTREVTAYFRHLWTGPPYGRIQSPDNRFELSRVDSGIDS